MTSNPGEARAPATSRLQEEIRQNLPFRSKAQEAFLSILRTGDLAKHRFSDIFDRAGVTFQQYNVLRILRGAGKEGLPTLEIGSRMIERTPGVTRILDRLESKKWVTRERCSEDRRKVWCRITPEGLALLARLDQPVDESDLAFFRGMDPDDLDTLIRILDDIRKRLSED